jgi:hypothetical protein
MPKWVTPAVQVLGAAAGLAALATFVGGAMLWLRFDGMHLPADRAVAVLPNELLLIVGAQALMLPVALGLGALLWLAVVDPLDSQGRVETRFWTLFMPVVAVLMVAIVAETEGLDVWVIAIAVAAALVGGLLIFRTAVRTELVRNIAWTVFGVFALLGALVNVLEMRFEPRMEPVAALLQKDDSAHTREGERGLAGFFVGETPERLWFVSLPGNGDPGDPFADAAVDRVVGIPRKQITRIAMREPAGVGDDESGREQAHTLLSELQVTVLGEDRATQPVTTTNPEVAFAPLVHLHSEEEWMPMSARGFLDESVLRWSNRGGDCKDATIAAGAARADVTGVPRIRDERLGPADPYVYAQPADCAPRAGTYRATQLTRPYHGKARPPDLLAKQGFHLDLRDDARKGHDETSDEGPRTFLRDVPVYVDSEPVTPTAEEKDALPAGETATSGLRLTYWMLYGLSEPPGPERAMSAFVHEGDWERISVRVARLGEGESNRYLPLSVRYFYHNHSRKIPWYAVRRAVGGAGSGQGATHPVAYSAEGSHASYWRAGRYEAVYEPKGDRLLAVNDNAIACPDCPQWHTWKLVLPARGQLWYGFGGAWGKVGGSGDTTGPLGPSEYKLEVDEEPTTVLVGEQAPVPTAPVEVEETTR